MTEIQAELLNLMLKNVGDLGFRRRVYTIIDWLDIQDGDMILDCGCGEGFYSMVISNLYPNANIVAYDFNAELLGKAAEWSSSAKNIVFRNGNIELGLDFDNEVFDKIIFSEVLEHLNDHAEALREVVRVLKSEGKIAVTVPNQRYPLLWDPLNKIRSGLGLGHFNPKNTVLGGVWAYDHKRLYSLETLQELSTQVGCRLQAHSYITHYCMPFNYLVLRLGKMASSLLPSSAVKSSMEKFEWGNSDQVAERSVVASILRSVFFLFELVDSLNDKLDPAKPLTSVSIGVLLTKAEMCK
jgi:ubiquinone/menaquinone biosynthesis C-methylase UbiE